MLVDITFSSLWMQDTVMLGADYYETETEREALLDRGRVPIGIGENTTIRYYLLYDLTIIFITDI